ncbi:MAG: class I SAM-dependent methyltransferase [Nanoarchaeota archaeon]
MENQERVWDEIAASWKTFRTKAREDVANFLNNKSGNILDLGCGSGRNFAKIDGIIYGVDFSEKMLEFARQKIKSEGIKAKLIKSDAFNLPFDDNFFDAAIFVSSLTCIPLEKNRKKSLEELYRVLKSGSEVLISVWDSNQERFKESGKESFVPWKQNGKEQMRYYYLYSKNELKELLEKVGFEIVKIRDSKNLDAFYSQKNIDVVAKKP